MRVKVTEPSKATTPYIKSLLKHKKRAPVRVCELPSLQIISMNAKSF